MYCWRTSSETVRDDGGSRSTDLLAGPVQSPSAPREGVHSRPATANSERFDHGRRMIYASFPSFFGLGLEDGQVPTFWLLLQLYRCCFLYVRLEIPMARPKQHASYVGTLVWGHLYIEPYVRPEHGTPLYVFCLFLYIYINICISIYNNIYLCLCLCMHLYLHLYP